jgi:hypothetical protein
VLSISNDVANNPEFEGMIFFLKQLDFNFYAYFKVVMCLQNIPIKRNEGKILSINLFN